jgi:hypothetical protein
MGNRIEDFDYTGANFLRHKAQDAVPFVEYFEARSAAFAKSYDGRRKLYLDTKFWVKLRKAAEGSPLELGDRILLEKLRAAVTGGRVVCPFSSPLWFEVFHQTDRTTRVMTASLIDELSLGLTIFTEEDRIAQEVGELFDIFVLRKTPREKMEHLVWSVPVCGLGIPFVHSRDWPETDANAIQKTVLDEMWLTPFAGIADGADELATKVKAPLAKMAEEMNRFRGTHHPAASFEEEHAREFDGALRGWRATIAQAVELSSRRHFGPIAQAGPRVYDEAAKRFSEQLRDAFLHGRLGNALPTLVIPAALHAAINRDPQRKFQSGDFHDFSHATVALAYCDAFATERALRHLLDAQLQFSRRYATVVFVTTDALVAWLDGLAPPTSA